ncbi:hypothetical protein [Halovulum sp. GXIMD14793]
MRKDEKLLPTVADGWGAEQKDGKLCPNVAEGWVAEQGVLIYQRFAVANLEAKERMTKLDARIDDLQAGYNQLTAKLQELSDRVAAQTYILRAASVEEEPVELLRKLDRVAEVYKDTEWEGIRPVAALVLGIAED